MLLVVLRAAAWWPHGCGCPTAYSLDFRGFWRALPCARVEHGAVLPAESRAGFLSIMILRALGPSRTPIVEFEGRPRRVRLVDLV